MSDHTWQKSSFSGEAANCVHVAASDHNTVRLRESDDPDVVLTTAPVQLRALIRSIKADAFNPTR